MSIQQLHLSFSLSFSIYLYIYLSSLDKTFSVMYSRNCLIAKDVSFDGS